MQKELLHSDKKWLRNSILKSMVLVGIGIKVSIVPPILSLHYKSYK